MIEQQYWPNQSNPQIQEDNFKNIIENNVNGILIVDNAGTVLYANPAAVNIFKKKVEELINKPFGFPVLADSSTEIEIINPSQQTSVAEMHCVDIKWKNKQATLITLVDISERKREELELKSALDRAEKADKLKSAFVANMSHEIRTPLNAIIGYVDLLISDLQQDEEVATKLDYLNIVKSSGKHLLSLINDILELSKIEADQITIEHKPASLIKILDIIRSSAEMQISQLKKNIQIKILLYDEIQPNIVTDETRLTQILNNLVSNAIKFTEKGIVEIALKLSNKNTLQFFVKDTGIGIPADKHKEIFLPFGQADMSSTKQYGGTGLGLTITRKYIHLMGGEISLESKINEGTTFKFTLPYQPLEQYEMEQSVVYSALPKSSEAYTILLADDNPLARKLVNNIMEKYGYNLIVAKDGYEAVQLFIHNPNIDLILMDIQMPVLDGYQSIKRIREYENKNQKQKIPIIALTAAAMKEDIEKGMQVGCSEYLTKPIDISELISVLKKYLKF